MKPVRDEQAISALAAKLQELCKSGSLTSGEYAILAKSLRLPKPKRPRGRPSKDERNKYGIAFAFMSQYWQRRGTVHDAVKATAKELRCSESKVWDARAIFNGTAKELQVWDAWAIFDD
jgi:hypothetical protein